MSANTVKKTFVNIYLATTDSGSGDTVCVPTPEISAERYERSKLDAILAAIVPCLDSGVAIKSVKKVEGYVVSEE